MSTFGVAIENPLLQMLQVKCCKYSEPPRQDYKPPVNVTPAQSSYAWPLFAVYLARCLPGPLSTWSATCLARFARSVVAQCDPTCAPCQGGTPPDDFGSERVKIAPPSAIRELAPQLLAFGPDISLQLGIRKKVSLAMPHIKAFRGLRYNMAQIGSLSDCIAPPYDVVDGQLQAELYAKSPYNFIRLELTKPEPNDTDPNAVYSRAASLFRQWRRDGVLQTEPDPAIYVYNQVFDYAGRTYTRRGFMARIRLVRFGEGNIYPHEQTHAKAKDDRLRLTRACQANLSQIFGLYPDPENAAQNLLEQHIAGKAALEAVDHLGVTHRMWPVSDMSVISQVATLVADKPMFVADGHHRYETACNYRDELAQAAGGKLPDEHPAQYVLSMMVSMDDPGLIVLPTHRLIQGCAEFTSQQIHSKLGQYFDCEVAGKGPKDAAKVWERIELQNDQSVLALYSTSDQTWTLASANSAAIDRMREIAPTQSDDWRGLGVALLHRLVFEDLLGLDEKTLPKHTYVHLVDEVVAGLEGRLEGNHHYPLAALVMPATVNDIRAVSLHNERMPAKSTYFYPKLLSGLVVNPLDAN